ncbi:MAG TPA: alpha/beta hydrolase [Gammaproteobacteria bacterium]|nr:alpha/beta hydrolase [Gammaproteobacteria bacterium]
MADNGRSAIPYRPMKNALWLAAILIPTFIQPAHAAEASVGVQLNARLCGLIDVAGLVENEMPVEPLYQMIDGRCRSVRPQGEGEYFASAACSGAKLRYKALSLKQFCAEAVDPERFGNGGDTEPGIWFQHPGLRLRIGLEPLKGHYLPYETRAVYKAVETARGLCKLEMRIYARRPGVSGLRPLLMLHGGSWQTHHAGMLGLQAQMAHYTDEGFVVFAPLYRLTGEAEGNPACNHASGEQIVEDAASALAWVRQHAADYGATPASRGVMVAGQSAGGQLAARLAIDHPQSVAAALLMYSPLDFSALLAGLQEANASHRAGEASLSAFIGQDAATAPVDLPVVQANSLPERALGVAGLPPIFLLHGDADTLVPVDQSARLCNALAGEVENGPAADIRIPEGRARRDIVCNEQDKSRLVVIGGADHALDYCLEVAGIPTNCPAGGVEARAAVRDALADARDWLKAVGGDYSKNDAASSTSGERDTPPDQARPKSGGGALFWLMPILAALRRATPDSRDSRAGCSPTLTRRA